MGQSRITTDSPAGVLLLGRLFDSDVFLHGFLASRRSSGTDKVRRDRLQKEMKKKQIKIESEFKVCKLLLVGFCWSEVVIIRRIHPADDVLSTRTRSGHLSDFGFPVELKKDVKDKLTLKTLS